MKNKTSLKGKTFACILTNKGSNIEDIPAMRELYETQLKEINAVQGKEVATMTETETAFEFNNGQFILKPVRPKTQKGKLVCGPSFATFEGVRIEYKDCEYNAETNTLETKNSIYALKIA